MSTTEKDVNEIERPFKYLVAYFYHFGLNRGTGSMVMQSAKPLNTEAGLVEMREFLKKELPATEVGILSFQELAG